MGSLHYHQFRGKVPIPQTALWQQAIHLQVLNIPGMSGSWSGRHRTFIPWAYPFLSACLPTQHSGSSHINHAFQHVGLGNALS